MRWIVITLVLVTAACGRDDGDIDELIGESCVSDRDCSDRCFTDPGDYPGGICSSSCTSDSDCTSDAYCIAKDGGICLFLCPEFACDRLGPGWGCHNEDRISGGSISVCIGN